MQARGCYLAIAVTLASTPAVARMRTETGVASWYNLSGRLTASGELFDRQRLTAAHPSLPFGSVIEVKNKRNGRTVLVTVNDRGPHAKARIIDLRRRRPPSSACAPRASRSSKSAQRHSNKGRRHEHRHAHRR